MEVTFLGTGTSHGIPVIGCQCAVCTSPNPRNRRNRTCIWLHDAKQSALIDIGSEFRISALQYGLTNVDFVLLTHAHSDHIAGMDDLRIFSQRSGKGIPILADVSTLDGIRSRFPYAFEGPKAYGGGVPQFETQIIDATRRIGPWTITPLPVLHGPEPILGFRIGSFAFITDVTVIPEATLKLLEGVDVLALDCLRRTPHSTHLHLAKSIEYAKVIGAKRTYMIHLAHELEHAETEAELPETCHVAYDGLTLSVEP
jgi:phosphoribosyl 1,2-cyclic phosphate phosphodiesterase